MSAFIHHLAYDFRTGIRDRSKLLMFYLFPLVFFALMGGLMSSVNPGFTNGPFVDGFYKYGADGFILRDAAVIIICHQQHVLV